MNTILVWGVHTAMLAMWIMIILCTFSNLVVLVILPDQKAYIGDRTQGGADLRVLRRPQT